MGCYYTLCHNTYAYSLLFYKVYMKRENAGSWETGLEKEKILETYSAQLQKSRNFTEVIFGNNKKYSRKNPPEGAHTLATRVGTRPTPPGAPPASWAPCWPFGAHLLLYEVFRPRKNQKQAYGTRLRRHEAEPWRNQSRAPAELFCRGHFPPGGGNHRHRHHQRSSHRERAISINIFTSTISSQTLVHLLYPILVSKSGIGASRLLVVLITPCS